MQDSERAQRPLTDVELTALAALVQADAAAIAVYLAQHGQYPHWLEMSSDRLRVELENRGVIARSDV